MTYPVPHQCPLDGGPIEVTEVSCTTCDTQMRGHFTLSRYDRLDTEQQRFLETFLRCRGVIRDVEAALGISYPTVKSRLEALLVSLEMENGFLSSASVSIASDKADNKAADKAADKTDRRKQILAAIDLGEIDAETGLRALKDL